MKLLLRERVFSWLDSYDVFDENGTTIYSVKGELSFGHLLKIYNSSKEQEGEVVEKIFSFLPKFELYERGFYIGCIKKELAFFVSRFNLDELGWDVTGDVFDWEYQISCNGATIAKISKQFFNFTDTYEIAVENGSNPLHVLMAVLAIDADNCSSNK